MRSGILASVLAITACAVPPGPAETSPSQIVLNGEITRADHQTYREIPFEVPAGTDRFTVDFSYTGKDQRTVIDIGMRDPEGQRGWSGGNKSHFVISSLQSTPSYTTGPIKPGTWHLVLGVPNIREGQTASYSATISFGPPEAEHKTMPPESPAPVLDPSPGWRRGDFHTHTAHSDGSCDLEGGVRFPCPPVFSFEAARDAGLDFVAITDHNTITQLPDIREMQADFPKTLLIPGTEITTFFGHANTIGNTSFLDFQLGSPHLPTLSKLFDEVDAAQGFLSVNHPSLPSGEACMGCGWVVEDTDWSRVTAIEIVNGSTLRTSGAEGAFSGIKFWDNLLRQGYRITAIGGSDNHDAKDTTGAKQSPIGKPATVVYASELSTKGVVAGVKSGRVFVDVAGLPGAVINAEARAGDQTALMGGTLALKPDETASVRVTRTGLPANTMVIFGAHNTASDRPTTGDGLVAVRLAQGATYGFVRPEIRDSDGKLLIVGNPIYLRAATSP